MKITTETGSYYEIKNGRWSKNGSGYSEAVWYAYCVPNTGYASWEAVGAEEHQEIQVGLRLYIGGKDSWWLSTAIVSIEE